MADGDTWDTMLDQDWKARALEAEAENGRLRGLLKRYVKYQLGISGYLLAHDMMSVEDETLYLDARAALNGAASRPEPEPPDAGTEK